MTAYHANGQSPSDHWALLEAAGAAGADVGAAAEALAAASRPGGDGRLNTALTANRGGGGAGLIATGVPHFVLSTPRSPNPHRFEVPGALETARFAAHLGRLAERSAGQTGARM